MRLSKTFMAAALVISSLQPALANTSNQDLNVRTPSHPGVYGHLDNRTGEQILIARDYIPWGGDVIPYLTAAGSIVTVIPTSDITLTNLSDYCLLLLECGTSQIDDPTEININAALGHIESYASDGGDVMYFAGTWGAIYSFPGSGYNDHIYENTNFFCTPDHPIALGVPNPFAGSAASHEYFYDLPDNATCITAGVFDDWTAAEYAFGQGHVVLMSQPIECYIDGGDCGDPYDFYSTLLENSVQYAMNCDNELVDANEVSTSFTLTQNHPNPFNPVTSIDFSLVETSFTTLSIYDLQGTLIAQPVNGIMDSGVHTISFDGSHLSSGIYFYSLEANNQVATRRMTLIK